MHEAIWPLIVECLDAQPRLVS
eukprot:SAG31_NODE_32782_length_351_cov_1.833333_1_plen_21_part_01